MGRKAQQGKNADTKKSKGDPLAERLAAELLVNANESSNPTLALLRSKYALLDKAEWWWLFDDALEEIGKCLTKDNFVLVDGFLPPAAVAACRGEIDRARREGRLEPGGLAGGTAGRATSYSLDAVRGDLMGWWSGDEPELGWSAIPAYLRKADTFVSELAKVVPELRSIQNRSKAMTTVYPGGGARYIRHVDNSNRNGRKLTVILYLNDDWQPAHGGALRIYRCLGDGSRAGFADCDGKSLEGLPTPPEAFPRDRPAVAAGVAERGTARVEEAEGAMAVALTDVAPLGGRLLAFFSDVRVPHEVLAAHTERFAVTVWFYAREELAMARSAPAAAHARAAAEEKIAKEIAEMQAKYGGVARVVKKPAGADEAPSQSPADASAETPARSPQRRGPEDPGTSTAPAGPAADPPGASDRGEASHRVGTWEQPVPGGRWQVQVHVPMAGQRTAAGLRLDLDPRTGVLELAEGDDAPSTRIPLPMPPEQACGVPPEEKADSRADDAATKKQLCAMLEAATVSARFMKKREELVVTVVLGAAG